MFNLALECNQSFDVSVVDTSPEMVTSFDIWTSWQNSTEEKPLEEIGSTAFPCPQSLPPPPQLDAVLINYCVKRLYHDNRAVHKMATSFVIACQLPGHACFWAKNEMELSRDWRRMAHTAEYAHARIHDNGQSLARDCLQRAEWDKRDRAVDLPVR
jgi:hypothetical protein